MGRDDFYNQLSDSARRAHDAQMEAEAYEQHLKRPDRPKSLSDALSRLNAAMARLDRDFRWLKGKLVPKKKKER